MIIIWGYGGQPKTKEIRDEYFPIEIIENQPYHTLEIPSDQVIIQKRNECMYNNFDNLKNGFVKQAVTKHQRYPRGKANQFL